MRCPKCSAELSDDTKFCSFCGTIIELGSNASSEQVKPQDSEAKVNPTSFNSTAKAPTPKHPNGKTSIAEDVKEKGIAYWNTITIFGKTATIAIVVFAILCIVGFLSGKVFAGILSLVQIALVVVAVLMQKNVIKIPYSWTKYAIIAVAVLFTALNISSYSWSANYPGISPAASSNPAQTTSVTHHGSSSSDKDENEVSKTKYTIEKGSQYAYMSDEWNVYIVTALSDSLVKVENWDKSDSSSKSVKLDHDIGSFKINDSANGFYWVDEEHTAFYMNLKDKDSSRLKKSKLVPFTINISESDTNKGSDFSSEIPCYTYTNDDWHMYRAIPLTESIIKIEVWSRSSSLDKFLYGYDMCIIDQNNTDTDFEWTDSERTSFTITTKDPDNSYYWKKDTLVAFVAENKKCKYSDVCDYLGTKIVGEGEIKTPADASDFIYKDYKKAQNDLAAAGFTNISTEIKYDIVLGWTEEGEVESVSINGDTSFKKGTIFKQDAPVIITYHMKEEDDPAKASAETSTTEAVSTETTTVDTTPAPKQSSNGIIFPQSGTKLDRDFDSTGSFTTYYINVDGTSNVPKLSNWGDAIITDSVSEYLEYLQSQGYTITVTGTNYREPHSGFHTYDTNFKVSNGITEWTMSLLIQDEKYVEYELDIDMK